MSYEEKVDFRSKSKLANKFLAKLRKLMIVSRKNLHHVEKFQKQAHNKGVKPRSYAISKNV